VTDPIAKDRLRAVFFFLFHRALGLFRRSAATIRPSPARMFQTVTKIELLPKRHIPIFLSQRENTATAEPEA
jgi:hypothetical protein